MKTVYLKIAVLISFLVNTIPTPHVLIPNGIAFIMSFSDFVYEPSFNFYTLLLFSTILSLFSILVKSKLINTLGIIIQIVWMIYIFDCKFLKLWYYTIPAISYLILSLTLLYFLFFKKEFKDKIIK